MTRAESELRGASWTGYAPLDAGALVRLQATLGDLAEGMRRWRSWRYLAIESVKNSYRRTVLGPWWITLQMAAFVLGLAVIFSQIQHQSFRSFLPYVAVGLIAFNLLSGLTRAATNVFISAAGTMKSTRQPLSSLVLRDVAVEFIQFGHNFLIYVVFLAMGLIPLSPRILIAVPVIAVFALNGLFLGLWLGISVARFRDVKPLVESILQALVFFTPVFYKLSALGAGVRRYLLGWNPFTYLLEAVREPLIAAPLDVRYYVGAAVVTALNVALGLVVFTRNRSRLPYWVA